MPGSGAEESDPSARATAAGERMAIAREVIGRAGTRIGGTAGHLLPLLMRRAPATLRAHGLGSERVGLSP